VKTDVRNGERSIGDLVGALATDTSMLVRQEVALATSELVRTAKYAGKQAMYVAIGGYVGLVGVQALLAAAVIGLGLVLPLWAAALAIGGFASLVALAIAIKGIAALKQLDVTPTETLKSLEENKSWIRNQLQ